MDREKHRIGQREATNHAELTDVRNGPPAERVELGEHGRGVDDEGRRIGLPPATVAVAAVRIVVSFCGRCNTLA